MNTTPAYIIELDQAFTVVLTFTSISFNTVYRLSTLFIMALFSLFPHEIMKTENKFDWQDLDEENNIPDLQKWVNERNLFGLIEEDAILTDFLMLLCILFCL